MIIPLNETYRITSDAHAWALQKYDGVDKDGKDRWEGISYHGTLSGCLNSYFQYRARMSKATSMEEAVLDLRKIEDEIAQIVKRLDYHAPEVTVCN